jgi:hypothetical protein
MTDINYNPVLITEASDLAIGKFYRLVGKDRHDLIEILEIDGPTRFTIIWYLPDEHLRTTLDILGEELFYVKFEHVEFLARIWEI